MGGGDEEGGEGRGGGGDQTSGFKRVIRWFDDSIRCFDYVDSMLRWMDILLCQFVVFIFVLFCFCFDRVVIFRFVVFESITLTETFWFIDSSCSNPLFRLNFGFCFN